MFSPMLFLEGFNPQADGFADEFCDAVVGSQRFDQVFDAADDRVVDADALVVSFRHIIHHLNFMCMV